MVKPRKQQYRHGSVSQKIGQPTTGSATTILPGPTTFSIDDIDGSNYVVSWTNNDDNGAPHVYVSTDGGTTWTDDSGALTASATSYTTSALSSANDHTLKVQVETPDAATASSLVSEVLAGSRSRRESGAVKANESGVVMTE